MGRSDTAAQSANCQARVVCRPGYDFQLDARIGGGLLEPFGNRQHHRIARQLCRKEKR
jgi:hypothetical protein